MAQHAPLLLVERFQLQLVQRRQRLLKRGVPGERRAAYDIRFDAQIVAQRPAHPLRQVGDATPVGRLPPADDHRVRSRGMLHDLAAGLMIDQFVDDVQNRKFQQTAIGLKTALQQLAVISQQEQQDDPAHVVQLQSERIYRRLQRLRRTVVPDEVQIVFSLDDRPVLANRLVDRPPAIRGGALPVQLLAHLFERLQQLVAFDRHLQEIVDRAKLHRLFDQLEFVVVAQHETFDRRIRRGDFFDQTDSIHDRHLDVGDDDVGRRFAYFLQRLLAVGRFSEQFESARGPID